MSDVFNTLNAINVNEKTEKKNGLTFLSWAWAWGEVKKRYPDSDYKILRWGDDQLPFQYVPGMGFMCWTNVTIEGETKEMWLPVMDGANKAMMFEPYTYTVKNPLFKYAKRDPETGIYKDKYGNEQTEYIEKVCEAATMFDVNKTIMRCLVKNLAMFGLGLYIYAGEDLPEIEQTGKRDEKQIDAKPMVSNDGFNAIINNEKWYCDECGDEITQHGKYTAEQIAASTKKAYGKELCWACSVIEKGKRKAAENAG